MQKANNLGNYFDEPLTESLRWGGWITVHKKWFFLKAAKCCLYYSASVLWIGLEFVLQHPGRVDLTVIEHFSWNSCWKAGHYTRQACENSIAHISVCLTVKSILLLNSSRNNSSRRCTKSVSYSISQQIGLDWPLYCSACGQRQTHKLVHVFSSPYRH